MIRRWHAPRLPGVCAARAPRRARRLVLNTPTPASRRICLTRLVGGEYAPERGHRSEPGAAMSGHDDVLTMDLDEFKAKVALVETAFRRHSAAFYFDSRGAGHGIDVFDFFEEVDDVDDWIELRSFAFDCHQLFFFAFEHAPEGVIRAWGDEHDGAGGTAFERVEIMREEMPAARLEWITRFTDLGPTLGDVATTHVQITGRDIPKTVLRMNSFIVEGLRQAPVASSRAHLSAVLSRNELRRLIDALRMADAMYDEPYIEDGDGEEVASDA